MSFKPKLKFLNLKITKLWLFKAIKVCKHLSNVPLNKFLFKKSKNRMLADFYISRLSDYIKMAAVNIFIEIDFWIILELHPKLDFGFWDFPCFSHNICFAEIYRNKVVIVLTSSIPYITSYLRNSFVEKIIKFL